MMTHISNLYYYPIKSCAGVEVSSASMTPRGFEHDREFLLVKTTGQILTQREYPRMALIQPAVSNKTLTLTAPDMSPFNLEIHPKGEPYQVTVWRSTCQVFDLGDEVATWFSRYLQCDCRLVRMADDFVRQVNPDFARRSDDQVSFADGYPFMLLSAATLADLNTRLAQPVPMNRFRPNIVVSDCPAYAEDSWQHVKLGEIMFDVAKPCSRCVLTTVDQQTAQTGKEPLTTLSTYRNDAQRGVLLGQYLLQHNNGILNVGDAVMMPA